MAGALGIGPRLTLLGRLSPAHPYNESRLARGREALAWRAFDSGAVARLGRRRHVLGIGDSHMAVLLDVAVRGVWLRPFAIGGATASGIQNPVSQTMAREIFLARLALAPRWQDVLLGLGEVDCGFVIWHRARSRGVSVAEQLEGTIDKYCSFIAEILDSGFRSVSVLSATLPTVVRYDEARGNPGLKLRSAIEVPLQDRTVLTHEYNRALSERCQELGATFFDTTPAQLDPDTGMVSGDLRLADDPHLEPQAYAQILAKTLNGLGAPWRES